MRTQVPTPAPPSSPAPPAPGRTARPPLPAPIPQPDASALIISAPVPAEDDSLGITQQPPSDASPFASEIVQPRSLPATEQPLMDASAPELKLEWLSSESVVASGTARLRYRLTLGSQGLEGAKIIARLEVGRIPSAYARSVTDCEGEAELSFNIPPSAQAAESLSFTAQVTHGGQSVTRRFSLSKKSQ